MMDENAGTEASRQLLDLARQVARIYVAELHPRAVLLSGSAAEGLSDHWSDLDVIVYHDELPPEEAIAAARRAAGGADVPLVFAPWDGESFGESYPLRGVECQVAHGTVAGMERDTDKVLVDLDVDSPYQKALDGLLHAIPLHGEEDVRRWRERLADYPEPLRRAMVERHLRFFPLWMIDERMAVRDAVLWRQQVLVEAATNLLAVLAGLNRLYFSSFQFKRMHAFASRMTQAPSDLAGRIDCLFTQPDRAATELESLVGETVELVERELPDVDTTAATRWLGVRPAPWALSP
jgi:hypothetical protein